MGWWSQFGFLLLHQAKNLPPCLWGSHLTSKSTGWRRPWGRGLASGWHVAAVPAQPRSLMASLRFTTVLISPASTGLWTYWACEELESGDGRTAGSEVWVGNVVHVAITGRGSPSLAGPRKGLGYILIISERISSNGPQKLWILRPGLGRCGAAPV